MKGAISDITGEHLDLSSWSLALEVAGCRSPLLVLNWITEGRAALAGAGLGWYSAPGFFSIKRYFPMSLGSFKRPKKYISV